jgi:hypothetical protein
MALVEREGAGALSAEELEVRAQAHLARPPGRSAAEDIAAFIELLREEIRNEDGPPGAIVGAELFRVKEDDILIDPSELAFGLTRSPLEVDAAVLRITPLLEHEIEDYPEVADLFLIRCLVDAVEAEVHLDLSDVWDEGEDFSNPAGRTRQGAHAQAPGLHPCLQRSQRK